MNAQLLAFQVSKFVLESVDLDVDTITEECCPYAQGPMVTGVRLPHQDLLNTARGQALLNSYSFHGFVGLNTWIKALGVLRDQMGYSLTDPVPPEMITLIAQMHQLPIGQWFVPVITLRGEAGTPQLEVKQVHFNEYVTIFKVKNAAVIFHHWIQTILFGFPFTQYNIEKVFQLKDPLLYMAARLFQGLGDQYLMVSLRLGSVVSAFLPDDYNQGQASTELQSTLNSLADQMMEEPVIKGMNPSYSRQINQLQSLLVHGKYLGSYSEHVAGLARLNLFSFPNDAYTTYLKKDQKKLAKVSFKTWDALVHGRDVDDEPGVSGDQTKMTALDFHGYTTDWSADGVGRESNPFAIFS